MIGVGVTGSPQASIVNAHHNTAPNTIAFCFFMIHPTPFIDFTHCTTICVLCQGVYVKDFWFPKFFKVAANKNGVGSSNPISNLLVSNLALFH